MEHRRLELAIDDRGAATVTLDRPPANAVDRVMMDELLDVADRLSKDGDVRVVVVRSALDGFFVAGADLAMIGDGLDGMRELTRHFQAVGNAWEQIPHPTVAALNGVTAGAGCEIALTCDFRVLARGARIGLPEVKVGLLPAGGGTQRLPRVIGRGPARDLLLRGRLIDADEALRVGLVTSSCAPEDLDAEVAALTDELLQLPPITLREIKRCAALAPDTPLHDGLLAEKDAMTRLVETEDTAEGVQAFVEKRRPRFRGR